VLPVVADSSKTRAEVGSGASVNAKLGLKGCEVHIVNPQMQQTKCVFVTQKTFQSLSKSKFDALLQKLLIPNNRRNFL
jgi:hypothetical protein